MEKLAKEDVDQTSELQQLKEQLQVQRELAQQAEAKLRDLMEDLEKRVAEKTFELRRSNAALQRQLARQKQLVAALKQERKFMKQAARERENLAALVENSYDFIAIAALNGQLLYVNQAGCQLMGLQDVDAVSSKCVLDFVHSQDRDFWLQEALPNIRQAGRWEGELGFGHFQTGELIPMRVHGFAIEDPYTKETIALATVSRNITEQKLAEEKLRRKTSEMEAIFQVLPDLYFRLDADGTYLDYHAGSKQDLYVPPTEFLGKKVSEVLPPKIGDRICSAIHQVLQTGELVILEFFLSMPNGEQWYEARLLPFLEKQVISIVRNITDNKQADEALKRSEKLYRTLVENFPNGAVVLFDRDFRYTIADGQELVAAGLSKQNLEGKTLWEAVSPKNREILEPKYRAALAGEQNTFELSYSDRIYSVTALPVRNEKGEIFAGMVVSQNITERKQAISVLQQAKQELEIRVEERTSELKIANALLRQEIAERLRVEAALRESEERFRSIFDRAAVGIAQVLLSGQFFLANQKFVDIVGYTVAELQQKTFPEITHPDDLTTNLAYYRQISAGEIQNYSMEKRYIRKDGLPVWVNMTVSLLRGNAGEPKYFILVVEDISDRKLAQEALRESEARLQKIVVNLFESEARLHTIVANLFDGLLIVDRFGSVRFANPAAGMLFNCQPEDLISQEFGLPISVSKTVEVDIFKSKGEISICEMCVVPAQWEGESVSVVSLRDITERKRALDALRESEERFRQLAENIQDIFWLLSSDGREILYVSPAYEQIWGRCCQDLYADLQSWIDSIHPEDREIVLAKIPKNLEGQATSLEYRILRPDGSIRWIWDRSFPIKDELGKVYRTAGIAEDITDRKLAEAQIKASLQEKEILLKEIHHRVKNNMQVISSLLELQSQSANGDQTIALLRESQHRIHSMALIHEQLYQSEHLDLIDFAEYIENLAANLFQSFGCTNNSIHLNLQVAQIFLNIETAIPCGLIINEVVSNSLKYAFPKGNKGEISILFRQANSQQFHLTIGDNGVGLPPNLDMETAGTLGLRLVRILTRQLKGVLEVDRHNGTQFTITFSKLNYRRRF